MDRKIGLVHTVNVTCERPRCYGASYLPTNKVKVVYGDSICLGVDKRPEAAKKNKAGKEVHYKLNRRPSASKIVLPGPRLKSDPEDTRDLLCAPKRNIILFSAGR